MRRGHVLAAMVLAVSLGAPGARGDVAVTVYNQNLGLVTVTRPFQLESGIQTVRMTDVASAIVPTSVRVHFPRGGVEIYEQNYRYDLVNTAAILHRYIDRTVRLIGEHGMYEGTLLSASGGMYVVQTDEGLKLVSAGDILNIDLEELPEGFYTRPTLEWEVGVSRATTADAVISYLTNSISWHAEYVAHLGEDDTRIDLSGWASIDNKSGATYKDAKLKLIAGDIHRAADPRRARYAEGLSLERSMAAPRAGFEERSFFEYHLYDLPRPTTIANKETKQITLFEPARASVEKKFKYRPYRNQTKVAVVVELQNSKENGLGIPLPAGLVRLTKSDIDGTSQLLGEDRIDHTPKDEELSFEVGNAFDLTPEFRVVHRREISKRVHEQDIEIKLRNHKDEAVTIEVEQRASRWAEWRIMTSSHPFEKVDAETFRFSVFVPPDEEVVLTYTLRTGA